VTVKVLYVDYEDGELVYVVCEGLSTTAPAADGESSSVPEPATAGPSTGTAEGWCNKAFIGHILLNFSTNL